MLFLSHEKHPEHLIWSQSLLVNSCWFPQATKPMLPFLLVLYVRYCCFFFSPLPQEGRKSKDNANYLKELKTEGVDQNPQ